MSETDRAGKVDKLAVVLSQRIKEGDEVLVGEMGSYLNNFSRSHIDKLYQKLVVGRQEVE